MSTEHTPASPPPIGIMPEWRWREIRMDNLRAAAERYEDAGVPVPPQWAVEFREHDHWLAASGRPAPQPGDAP